MTSDKLHSAHGSLLNPKLCYIVINFLNEGMSLMLFLSEQQQAELLNMKEVINEVANALQAYSEGKTENPLRYALDFNDHNRYLVMPALSDSLKIVGVKTVTFAPNNAGENKPTIVGSVILSDYDTGETLSVLDAGFLTKVRTGAISGVATKYLARQDAKVLAVIGAGVQAKGLIEAVLAVRDIKTIHLSSRTIAKAQHLATQLRQQLDIDVHVFDDADDAINDADIIVTATNSSTPVFSSPLQPGVHINAVGSFKPDMQELPTHAVSQANQIVIESQEAAFEETGDLIIPMNEGVINDTTMITEIGHIISDQATGRTSSNDITLFKSVGLAIVDIVVANYFYKKANNI